MKNTLWMLLLLLGWGNSMYATPQCDSSVDPTEAMYFMTYFMTPNQGEDNP